MMSDEELDKLSGEELLALSQELDMDSLKDPEQVAAEQPTPLDALSDEELVREANRLGIETDNGLETGEAMARGVAQALTLGFHDEMTGVIEALKRKVVNGDEGDFMELYTQERDVIRGKNQKAEKMDGSSYLAGSLAGSIPTGFARGFQGLAGAVKLGGLAGLGFGEQEDMGDVVADSLLGASIGAAFEKTGQAASNKFKSLLSRSKNNQMKKIMAQKTQSDLPEDKIFQEATSSEILAGNVVDMDSYAGTAQAKTRARAIPQKIVDTTENALAAEKGKLAAQTAAIQKELGNPRFNFTEEFSALDTGVSSLPGIGNQQGAISQIKSKVLDPLKKEGLEIDGEMVNIGDLSLSQFHKINQLVNRFRFSADEQGRALRHLDPEADQLLVDFGSALTKRYNAVSTKIEEVNKKWVDLYRFDAVKPTKPAHVPYLLDEMGTSDAAINGQQFLVEAVNYDEQFAKTIYNSVDSDLKFWEVVNTAHNMKVGIGPIFQISAGSGLGAAAGGFLGGPAGAVVGGALGAAVSIAGPERRVIAHTITKAAKDAFKIPRNMSGIMKNADIIQSKIADFQGSSAAITFANAVAERDTKTIESMVSTALQNPATSAEFESGVGFDGKIMTLEEANMLKQQVFSSNLPVREQMRMITEINGGMIPQSGQQQQPFVRSYQKRRRDEDGRKI